MANEKTNHYPNPGQRSTLVMASEGTRVQLLADGTGGAPFNAAVAFNTGALPAASAWLRSQIVCVRSIRNLRISVSYNANAATVAGSAEIIPLTCTQYGLPLSTDDVWDVPTVTDGSVTVAALAAGTLPATNVITRTFKAGKITLAPVAFELAAASANSDKGRMGIDMNVEVSTYVMFYAREVGDAANPGTLDIWYCGSV